MRRSPTTVRVTVELSDAENGITIWADTSEDSLNELFTVQDGIVRRIVAGIAPHIREEELRRALRRHPESMSAYDLTLQALHLMEQLDPAIFGQARGLLGRAMEIDPRFAMPVAWAVWWHVRWVGQNWSTSPEEDRQSAALLAERAIALDPQSALALAMQGHLRSFLFHDYDNALLYFDRAIAVGPNHSIAVILYALTLAYVGRGEEAVRYAEYGLRLSPLDRGLFLFHNVLAWTNYSKGTYDEAVKWARLSANEAPAFTANLRVLIASLAAVGLLDEARAAAGQMLRFEPDFSLARYERTRQPFRDGPVKVRYLNHLHSAELPPCR